MAQYIENAYVHVGSSPFQNFLLTSSMLEEGLLLSKLSGMQFQDVVFQSSNCA